MLFPQGVASTIAADDDREPGAVFALESLVGIRKRLSLDAKSAADRFECDVVAISNEPRDGRVAARYRIQRNKDRAALLCVINDERVQFLLRDGLFFFVDPVGETELDWCEHRHFKFRFPLLEPDVDPDVATHGTMGVGIDYSPPGNAVKDFFA